MNRYKLLIPIAIVSFGAILPGCQNHSDYVQPDTEVRFCSSTPAPTGYLRINSTDQGLAGCPSPAGYANVLVYRALTDFQKGESFIVCSDDDLSGAISVGWVKSQDAYRDASLCDSKTARVINDPNYLNVMTVTRTR